MSNGYFFELSSALPLKNVEIARVLGVNAVSVSRWRTNPDRATENGPALAALRILAHLHTNYPDVYREVVGMWDAGS
jgi:hypothetical protein